MGLLEGHPVIEPFLVAELSPYFWYYNGIGNRIYTLNLPPAPFVLADLLFPKYPFTQLSQSAQVVFLFLGSNHLPHKCQVYTFLTPVYFISGEA